MELHALTDTYENLVTAGVIDPTKVVRTAHAASVAGMPGGGMGGMDF